MTLDDAIATLYAREINCGCETFWDGGIKVWISDIMNGHHSETNVAACAESYPVSAARRSCGRAARR